MAITCIVGNSVTANGTSQFTQLTTLAEGSFDLLNEALTSGANTISWSSDVSQLKEVVLSPTTAGTLVLRSTSTPTNTFTLSSTVPFTWTYGSGITNPFTGGDFNNFIITVGASGTLRGLKLEDPSV